MSKPTAQLTKMVTCSIINVGKSYRLDEINMRNFVERMFVYPKGEDDSNKTKGHD